MVDDILRNSSIKHIEKVGQGGTPKEPESLLSADIPHYLKYIENDLIMNNNYNILWMFFKFEKKG